MASVSAHFVANHPAFAAWRHGHSATEVVHEGDESGLELAPEWAEKLHATFTKLHPQKSTRHQRRKRHQQRSRPRKDDDEPPPRED